MIADPEKSMDYFSTLKVKGETDSGDATRMNPPT